MVDETDNLFSGNSLEKPSLAGKNALKRHVYDTLTHIIHKWFWSI